jgi:signal peptidase II
MVIGGALGNLHDRIFFKDVPDIIDFHIGSFHWFIFNVSDIFITFGIIFLIVLEISSNKEEKYE